MIDSHIHVVPPRLPGVGPMNLTPEGGVAEVVRWLQAEMAASGTEQALAMGCLSTSEDDPLGVATTLEIAAQVPGLFAIGVAHPEHNQPDHLQRVEKQLATGQVKALKGYLGYLHYPPTDAGYRPYYELAEKFKIPFVFHTGDTYSPYAKVRFAHPLLIDDVAVDHPNVRFVLAHVGNPWMMDAAEVVYKNMNVWADLSGLMIGATEDFTAEENADAMADTRAQLARAFRYAERPNRFLYGTDWPLAPMTAYRDFIAASLPEACHEMIFVDNARRLFRL